MNTTISRSKAKCVIFLIISFAVLFEAKGQDHENLESILDRVRSEKARIAGSNIKTQTTWIYQYSDGKLRGADGVKTAYFEYHRNGNMRKQINYNPNGSELNQLVISYDSSGNVDEISTSTSDALGGNRIEYEYDNDSILTSAISYDVFDNANMIVEFQYDPDGNIAEVLTHNPEKTVYVKSKFRFDKYRRLIETTGFDAEGKTMSKLSFQYEGDDNKISEQITEIPAAGVILRTKNRYDTNGNLTEMISRNAEGRVTSKITQKFNGRGQVKEIVNLTPAANLSSKTVYEYDGAGNIREQITYNKLDEPVTLIKYEYEYYEQSRQK
ncbi:MAG: hypothetical protein IIA45_02550 [Bacteroidetes bacterium]|nr:hypothetical protein [Bacteroidota bacterium]